MFAILTLFALQIPSCETDLTAWERFNANGDAITVEVTSGDELGDDVESELFSNTGAVSVGSVAVSPGSGPIGTDHVVTVVVVDEFQDTVGRVRVEAQSDRGLEKLDLVQDLADPGLWILTLTSSGVEGEVRTDSFGIGLYREVAADSVSDTASIQ